MECRHWCLKRDLFLLTVQKEVNNLCQAKFLAKTSEGPWSSGCPCGPQTHYKEQGCGNYGENATGPPPTRHLHRALQVRGPVPASASYLCLGGLAAFGRHGFWYQKSITRTHIQSLCPGPWSAFIFIRKGWVRCGGKIGPVNRSWKNDIFFC